MDWSAILKENGEFKKQEAAKKKAEQEEESEAEQEEESEADDSEGRGMPTRATSEEEED